MIRTVAVQGYRSLRDLLLPLGQLSVITGANGSGKSSVYRSLRLLADAALNSVVASLAREGGLPSTFWAGPETIARGVRHGTYAVDPPVPFVDGLLHRALGRRYAHRGFTRIQRQDAAVRGLPAQRGHAHPGTVPPP